MPSAEARPLLVCGSPRSGTTLLGAYLASASDVCCLGEYAGFYFAHHVAEREFLRVPGRYKDRYLAELRSHALDFPQRVALEEGCSWYCDATPWNLLVARELAQELRDALYVLVIRDVRGVVDSLARSHQLGYPWAGAGDRERAELWRLLYSQVRFLDPASTVLVDYDRLCAQPTGTLAAFRDDLAARGFEHELDESVFCRSHANPGGAARPTIGTMAGARAELHPVSSVDLAAWPPERLDEVSETTANVAAQLDRFRLAVSSSGDDLR